MTDAIAAINARIDRFVALLRDRDPALLDEIWTPRGFVLVGSERGEVFRTREALARKFEAIFANPRQLVFAWPARHVTVEGDVAWVLAEGELIYRGETGDDRRVYNATFIFQHLDGEWRWRQFFGSEPA